MNKLIVKALALAGLLTAASLAQAHTGHGTHGVADGLSHPFGADHLLAMVAVGVWAARALPVGRRVWGPGVFLLAMLAGAAWGRIAGAPMGLEAAIALSVTGLAALILTGHRLSARTGLITVAVAAACHGVAHGAEMPLQTSVTAYAAGFLLSTALLHAMGLWLGHTLLQRTVAVQRWAWPALATGLGASGAWLLLGRI